MYTFNWDSTTGGYILTTTASVFSKEPRPVYYKELDILGFDKHWKYEKDDSYPYMWAESNLYIYRGRVVAKTIGGGLYTAPTLDVIENGLELRPVDINTMIAKNKEIMDSLVNETIKKVYSTYMEYKKKIDVFYVAFSGGKDSIVLLDIVQRALPHNEFKVVFGDTDMEISDTYEVRRKVEDIYNDIDFYTSKSKLKALDSWDIFGPPAHIMRWCCSVHKTSPQMILLREITKKPNFKGMAFIGVRKDESAARSEYDTISQSQKHDGQFSCNAIDEWNSAELYLYIYQRKLLINEAYKKGNIRVGCLVCPMASGRYEYIKMANYPEDTEKFINKIAENSSKNFESNEEEKAFLNVGGWKARRNGRELKHNQTHYSEILEKDTLIISIDQEKTNWKIWAKTVGTLIEKGEDTYTILNENKEYPFQVRYIDGELVVKMKVQTNTANDIKFISAFKILFRKAAYCVKCRVCEANCRHGFLEMKEELKINDKCVKCKKCQMVDYGCLVYNSLRMPKGDGKSMSGMNNYLTFGTEKDWVGKFIKYKDKFWESEHNDLGSVKIRVLKRFLKDAELATDDTSCKATKMVDVIEKIGIDAEIAWALILVNLSYIAQFSWYIKNIKQGKAYIPESIKMMLGDLIEDPKQKDHFLDAYKNILTKTPIGKELGLGVCDTTKKTNGVTLNFITRTSWRNPDSRVILYGLYKFAENCGDYYQFTLGRLMNYDIDSNGVSPSLIFGIDEDTITKILNGLSVNHPKFINVSFTHDLDNITLNSEKTSVDVLTLF